MRIFKALLIALLALGVTDAYAQRTSVPIGNATPMQVFDSEGEAVVWGGAAAGPGARLSVPVSNTTPVQIFDSNGNAVDTFSSGSGCVNSAAGDPGVGDDSGDGYTVGCIWVNTTSDAVFVLVDATLGAAVWAATAASAIDTLDELTDVTITSVQTGDVLTYTGAEWENAAPALVSHNILSAGHADSLTGTLVAGDTLYVNNSALLTRLPKGNNGETLRLQSGLPAWTNPNLKSIALRIGSDTATAVLADTDDELDMWQVPSTWTSFTITKVTCKPDTGGPTIQLQKNDGSAANMFSSALTCNTTPSGTDGSDGILTSFVSGENVMAAGDWLNYLTVTAGGAAKRVSIQIEGLAVIP